MILIKNREMIFPNRENYIGTTYDNNSTVREFRIERQSVDGVDPAALVWNLQIKYEDTEKTDEMELSAEEFRDYIVLTWTVPSNMAKHSGSHIIGIKGFERTGMLRYSTYPAFVHVESWIEHPEPSGDELTIIEQLAAKVKQYEEGYDLSVQATADAVQAAGDAKRASEDADNAARNANDLVEDIQEKLVSGELRGERGEQGEKGEKGEQGESGVMAPSNGMFTLWLDPETGNLYADYPDGANPPAFEYDESTGDLYYVTPDPPEQKEWE